MHVKTINEFRKELDNWFSGQPELKNKLAQIGHQYVMTVHAQETLKIQDPLPRQIMMVVGKTGSGKTFCLEQFAKFMGMPFKRIDCNSLSQGGGWSGVDILENIENFDFERGIIFLDEFDKLSNRVHSSGGGDVTLAVQSSLLDILEGKTVTVETNKGFKSKRKVDTSKFIIFLGGSFQEQQRYEKEHDIGFNSLNVKEDRNWRDYIYQAGIIKEIVGRITHMYEMQELTDEELRHAILNIPEGAYMQYYNLFKLYHQTFYLCPEKIKDIIEKTKKSEYGLREINNQISEYANNLLNAIAGNVPLDTAEKIDNNISIGVNKGAPK